MPFKSEAQRKYLWANEPEIAREWTDTYGSGIQKAGGQLVQPGPGRPGYQGGHQKTYDAGKAYERAVNVGGERGREQHQQEALRQFAQLPTRSKKTTVIPTDTGTGKGNFINTISNYIRNTGSNLKSSLVQGRAERELRRRMDLEDEDDVWTPTDEFSSEEFSPENLKRVKEIHEGFPLVGEERDFNIPRDKYYDIFPTDRPNPNIDPGGTRHGPEEQPWLYPPTGIASTPAATSVASTLGGGHFLVPLEYVKGGVRAAEGGIIGSVGGTSRQKYQGGNMVGAEMEGEEMEGAMMQSKEVISELYEALIAQGLSPEEAMKKIREILAAAQAEEPEAPMMGEEFPGQEFGGGPRAPAAFGGIMDTYSGRRKYGLGSFNPFKAVKKAVNKVKKLASSKLGKLALMYAAGTYLGGTQALGGAGWGSTATPWKTFGKQLLDPKFTGLTRGTSGIGNVFTPSNWGMFQQAAPRAAASWPAGRERFLGQVSQKSLPSKIGKYLLDNPMATILGSSALAGAYTAQQPLDDLDDSTSEYDEKKAEMDAYLAPMIGAYRVPKEYVVPRAEGGRIGRQEGGLMDLGGMEKDYRNDGGFVPLGGEEKADDVPARLSRNEFVFTADAVKNAGGGDIDRGAEVMENVMKNLEAGGKVSEESQGQGAQDMFEVSERLSEVV
jgi:hypothetical protein